MAKSGTKSVRNTLSSGPSTLTQTARWEGCTKQPERRTSSIDPKGILVYAGALDDRRSWVRKGAKQDYLKLAIDSVKLVKSRATI